MNQNCLNCGRIPPLYHNYCNWDCHVQYALKNGAVLYTPNGLPVRCITKDNLLVECEHGDHPHYLFPVEAKYVDEKPEEDFRVVKGDGTVASLPEDWIEARKTELHALIYTDGHVALTMSECCYMLWDVDNGKLLRAPEWMKPNKWKLSPESRDRIRLFMCQRYGRAFL